MKHLPYILMALALVAVCTGLAVSPGAVRCGRTILADWDSPGPGANTLALLTLPGEPLRADIEVRHRLKVAGRKGGKASRIYSARVAALRADHDAGMSFRKVALKHGTTVGRVAAICTVSHHTVKAFK